ncbi:MAG: FAD/NAD(P)-binding protein, partial [Angustibacter sp.]
MRRALPAVLTALSAASLAVTTVAPASASAPGGDRYVNPVSKAFADTFADPSVIRGKDGYWYAYGTSDPRHLLNVRARHMSAYADVPSDLLDWARRTGRDPDPLGFLPRMEYSAYLQDTLADVADHRLTISAGRVDDLVRVGGG